jgi:hypothetical protein
MADGISSSTATAEGKNRPTNSIAIREANADLVMGDFFEDFL